MRIGCTNETLTRFSVVQNQEKMREMLGELVEGLKLKEGKI